jgi:hypothetical protein
MAIYADHAFCYSCRTWESYWEHIDRVGDEPPEDYVKSTVDTVIYTEEELNRLVNLYHKRLIEDGKDAALIQRGLTNLVINRYRLGYSGRAFSIPIHFNYNNIKTIRFRRDDAVSTTGSKYYGIAGMNDVTVFAPEGIDNSRALIVCEGEFDCLIGIQLGYNIITLTNGIGANIEILLPYLKDIPSVRVCVDNDAASYAEGFKIGNRIKKEIGCDVRLIHLPAKDITDTYLKYGEDKLRRALGSCH